MYIPSIYKRNNFSCEKYQFPYKELFVYFSINRGCYNLYIYNTSGPQVRWGEESVGSDGSCGQSTQQLISLEEYSKVYLKLKEKYAQEFIKAIDWLSNSWYLMLSIYSIILDLAGIH